VTLANASLIDPLTPRMKRETRKCSAICKCEFCTEAQHAWGAKRNFNHCSPRDNIDPSLRSFTQYPSTPIPARLPAPPSPHRAVSYHKAENRVHFDHRPNIYQHQHNPNTTLLLQQQLDEQTYLIQQQQKQIAELQARMVIPVMPQNDPWNASSPQVMPHPHGYSNNNNNTQPRWNQSIHRYSKTDSIHEDDEETQSERSDKSDRKRSRRQNSNNNNRHYSTHYSDTDTDGLTSDDETPLVQDDKGSTPALQGQRATIAIRPTPEVAVAATVGDKCCGTCCGLAAVATCAIILVLAIYPVVFLFKHSAHS